MIFLLAVMLIVASFGNVKSGNEFHSVQQGPLIDDVNSSQLGEAHKRISPI